jgi:uncharacterized membrane protein HdeD (DUF308 family)
MHSGLVISWWALALRGLLAIAFGIMTFVMPGLTLAVLVMLFGGYALAEGVVSAAGAYRASLARERWWPQLLHAALSIAAGAFAFFRPGQTLVTLVVLIAGWSLLTGVLEIVSAVRLRKEIEGEWLLGLAGLASIAFGLLLLVAPVVGLLTIALWVGIYALIFGVVLVALALRLRPKSPGAGRPPPLRPVPGV